MAVIGLSLSFSGIGTVIGVPLGIFGASLSAVGGVTTGITIIVENFLKKIGMKEIQKHLSKDYFRSEQICVVVGRSVSDSRFAAKWKIGSIEAASFSSFIPRLTKIGVTTTISLGMRASMGMGRVVAVGALHVTGILLAAALIPLDLAQMIKSSLILHSGQASTIVMTINERADQLENELRLFLLDGNHFHLIHCRDGKGQDCWTYVVVSARNLGQFLTKRQRFCACTYEEVRNLGIIIKEGSGADVPRKVMQEIETGWYDLHKTYLASLQLT